MRKGAVIADGSCLACVEVSCDRIGVGVSRWPELMFSKLSASQVWPRGAAIAERLWSVYDSTTDSTAATPRLTYHRCRLVQRGIAASPIGPGFCPPVV